MAKILIIEDEPDLAELIALYSQNAGWEVLVCHSAEEALGAVRAAEFDLVTLDINLPGMDGLQFLQKMHDTLTCPVIVVSARETDDDIISGLSLGADEYVTKPFAPKVLVARMEAVLRRSQKTQINTEQEQYQIGNLLLEPDHYSLTDGDERLRLSTREFDILMLLARANSKPLSAYDILDQVWGQQSSEASAVGVYIQRIRKKLEPHGAAGLLETVHGRGYALSAKRIGG
jgi:two-component system response regulator RegX3